MSSIIESDAKVRGLLNYPKPNTPPVHQRHSVIVRNIQHLYNKLANSAEAWAMGETTLEVSPSQSVYDLGKSDRLGKILLISTVACQPREVERPIPFFDVQNLSFDWNYPPNYQNRGFFDYFDGNLNNERMAVVYNEKGHLQIHVNPLPRKCTKYRVKYSIGNWARTATRESEPILSQFHDIFEIRSAKDLLYMCEWQGFSKKENVAHRKEIKFSLDEQELRFLPELDRYIREMTQPKMSFRRSLY